MVYSSAAMAGDWSPESWQAKTALQQPVYPDAARLREVLDELAQLPPLVTSWEIERLKGELAQAARSILRNPGFTATAGVILALGLGLTSYMFGAIDAYFLMPLPFKDPDRLVHVERARVGAPNSSMEVPLHDFLDWREAQKSFTGLAAFYSGTVNLSGDDQVERYNGAFVSANTFELLGIPALIGRGFASGDDAILPAMYPSIDKIASAIAKLPNPVRLEGAEDQWREVPPRQLSVGLVAGKRLVRATGGPEPCDKGRLGRPSDPAGRNASAA